MKDRLENRKSEGHYHSPDMNSTPGIEWRRWAKGRRAVLRKVENVSNSQYQVHETQQQEIKF